MGNRADRAGPDNADQQPDTDLIMAVAGGEIRPCPLCGARLVFRTFEDGVHPGVYCADGHSVILVEMAYGEGGEWPSLWFGRSGGELRPPGR